MNNHTHKSITLIAVLLLVFTLGGTSLYAASGACRVQGAGRLEIDNNKLKWELTN